ncbi:MAG: hypothetical protein E4G96_05440, partial [Chrysiogenales bacterium]
MHTGMKRGWRSVALFAIVMSLAGTVGLHSQYILDQEEKKAIEEVKPQPVEIRDTIPAGIAFNIKATRIPDITDLQCAIKVSWDLNPGYTGEYVVARSDRIIDTKEKALAARIIQTVNATTNNTIIDTDCTPGTYYFAVLSKRSVLEGSIELHREVNYTSIPVNIQSPDALFRVTGIRAALVDGDRIRVIWNRTDKSGIFYTIYRSRNIIDTETRLREADRVRVIADSSEYVDDSIPATGTYYYAVTAKVLYGIEDVRLVTDENCTSVGVEVGIQSPVRIQSITARGVTDGIEVIWGHTGSQGQRLYSLFRSDRPLLTLDGADGWTIIQKVDISGNRFTDVNPPPGEYYYGLVPDGGNAASVRLVPGVTITRQPVRQGKGKKAPAADNGDI